MRIARGFLWLYQKKGCRIEGYNVAETSESTWFTFMQLLVEFTITYLAVNSITLWNRSLQVSLESTGLRYDTIENSQEASGSFTSTNIFPSGTSNALENLFLPFSLIAIFSLSLGRILT
jgi:hypothetical protein